MSTKLLRLESDSFSFGLIEEYPPYKKDVGNLTVYEVYTPADNDSSDVGSYKIIIEGEVENHSELEDRNIEAIALAEELEMLWSYVWVTPLHIKTRAVILEFPKPPKGWDTNKEDIRKELDIERGGLTYESISFSRNETKYSNTLPLERGLRIREKYQKAETIIKTLIDFHFESLSSRSMHSSLFLLSKGLEITRAYLPGKSDDEKENNLPPDAKSELRNSYHKLFGLANNRLNTRHAVRRKSEVVELHPELEGSELEDFYHDCDLIIRSVVCDYFKEEIVLLKKKARQKVAT
jgi:hypothetical protein